MNELNRLRVIHKLDQLLGHMALVPPPQTAMVDITLYDGVVVVTPMDLIHHEICWTDCLCCPCWCH